MVSTDATHWKKSLTAIHAHLRSVAWTGSVFVAVGDTGTIITSKDAVNWTSINSNSWKNFKCVIWNNSQLVLVGDNTDNKPINKPGAVYTSMDGNTWTLRNQGTTTIPLNSVIWTGQKFVAIGSGGKILTSPDGIVWTSISISYTSTLSSIAYSGTIYVAHGNGDTLLTSTDAAQWTIRTTGYTNQIRSSCWARNNFIAVGDSGIIINSMDGITWEKNTSPASRTLSSVLWNGKTFCAVGDTGTVLASSDGLAWSLKSTEPHPKLHSIIWGNNLFVALGESGSVYTSPDGLAWTNRTSGTTTLLNEVTWNGAKYVAIGTNGPIITSPNGMDWNIPILNFPDQLQLHTVAGNSTQFIALGKTYDNGQGIWRYIYSSPDGVSWTSKIHGVESSSVNTFGSMVWTGDLFVAVGNGVLTSNDGNYWNEWSTTDFNDEQTTCVSPKETTLYVTTNRGSIYFHTSGYSWSRAYSDPKSYLSSICWNGSEFLAVGIAGKLITSPDGSNWTSIDLGYGETPDFYSIIQTFDRMVIFGDKGLVLSAPKPVVSTLNGKKVTISKISSAGKLSLAKKQNHFVVSAAGCTLLGRRIINKHTLKTPSKVP